MRLVQVYAAGPVPSSAMRRKVLLQSVERLLGGEGTVRDAAYVWTRHHWSTWFGGISFLGLVLAAPIGGIEDWPTRIVLGLAGVAVATLATTDYRVVADTADGLAIFRASRIRQVATQLENRLGTAVSVELEGGTIIYSDWRVGKHLYTVPRSSQSAMERIAARY